MFVKCVAPVANVKLADVSVNNTLGPGTVTDTVMAAPVASLKVTVVEPALTPVISNLPSTAGTAAPTVATATLLLSAV